MITELKDSKETSKLILRKGRKYLLKAFKPTKGKVFTALIPLCTKLGCFRWVYDENNLCYFHIMLERRLRDEDRRSKAKKLGAHMEVS